MLGLVPGLGGTSGDRLLLGLSRLQRRSFGGFLDFLDEGGLDLPTRRIVAAEDAPELLAQVILGVAVFCVGDGRFTSNPD